MAVALAAVGGPLLATPGQAAPDGSEPAKIYRDYLDADMSVQGPVDQCSKPASERKGGWVCLESEIVPNFSSCSFVGCWSYNANYWATFHGDGLYGWEENILGYTDVDIQIKFTGGSSTSRPYSFRSTRGTRTVNAVGEGLYFSAAHPEGYPVSGGATYRVWTSGAHAADVTVACFGSSGYSAYAGGVAWAGVAYEIIWTDPSSQFFGEWYVWVKSPKFQRNASGAYILADPPPMGANWYGSGWNPVER